MEKKCEMSFLSPTRGTLHTATLHLSAFDNNKSTLNYRWLQRFIDFSSSSLSAKIKCDLNLLLARLFHFWRDHCWAIHEIVVSRMATKRLFTRRNKLKYLLALGERARAVDLASVFMNLISLTYGWIRFVWRFLSCVRLMMSLTHLEIGDDPLGRRAIV